MIGIDPKHLSRIEVGKSYPSIDGLERLARALGVEIKDFFKFKHLAARKEIMEGISKMLTEAMKETGIRQSIIITLEDKEHIATDYGMIEVIPAWFWIIYRQTQNSTTVPV